MKDTGKKYQVISQMKNKLQNMYTQIALIQQKP